MVFGAINIVRQYKIYSVVLNSKVTVQMCVDVHKKSHKCFWCIDKCIDLCTGCECEWLCL